MWFPSELSFEFGKRPVEAVRNPFSLKGHNLANSTSLVTFYISLRLICTLDTLLYFYAYSAAIFYVVHKWSIKRRRKYVAGFCVWGLGWLPVGNNLKCKRAKSSWVTRLPFTFTLAETESQGTLFDEHWSVSLLNFPISKPIFAHLMIYFNSFRIVYS